MPDHTKTIHGPRLVLLSRIAFLDEWRPFFLAGAIIGGLVFLYGLAAQTSGRGGFIGLALIIGVVLSSKIFNDLYTPEQGTAYLMLPASLEEKFLVKLLATTVVYFVYIVLVMLVANTLAGTANYLFHGTNNTFYNPFTDDLWSKFKTYVFFHSIFFVSSLYIKKNSFLKTILVCLGISFLVMLVMSFLVKFYLVDNLTTFMHLFQDGNGHITPNLTLGQKALPYLKALFFYVLPLALYAAAYFKLKKIEIKG
jgi:hypothetical protein